jgi:alpha-galactosidase
MTTNLFALHGARSSLVIECPADGVPLWRYWGPRLADGFAAGPALQAARPTPSFSIDPPAPFAVFPAFGLGWYGQSALLAHRAGCDFAQGFTAASVEWAEPGRALKIALEDAVASLRVEVLLALDPASDVLTISTSLTNLGTAPLDVQWLAAAALPLPDNAQAVRHYSGRHNSEFVEQTDPLGRGIWRRENRRGLTSHDCFPGAVVLGEGTTQHSGTAWGAQLAWSGNSAQQIEWLDDGRYQWQLGEWLAPGEVRLAPGESLTSPEVLATCSEKGLDGVAANFHAAIRARVVWPGGTMAPRPALLNTWEGYFFDHDPARLIQLADAAAEIGIERFVLDDGWFHRRDNDSRALGDWWVDVAKYPDGLAPLAHHVTELGMQFGLWFEPEMVNPDSDLLRAHPDWALQIAGRPQITAREQLVLDLSRPEVGDYLFDKIGALLRDLPIGYVKWDHNRDLAPAAGADGCASYHRQVEAAYALFARFRAAFPALEIESCAGGGGRIDAGVARHVHRFWTSDCIDALSRIDMQRGFLQFMPPEMMGAHIGASPSHSTGRALPLAFQAAMACQGHLGLEFDLLTMDQAERAELAGWIGFYNHWRHLLHAQVWRGSAGDSVVWHAAGSADEWLLLVYRPEPMRQRHAPPVRLPFVAEGTFAVREIAPGFAGDPLHYDASWLAQAGLVIQPAKAHTAQIFHGRRV